MADELESRFGELAHAIPTTLSGEGTEYVFSADTLPAPPADLTTKQLYIEKGISEYDECFRLDMVTFHAHKETYRHLALLILAVVFHFEPLEQRKVTIHLAHPASQVTTLIVGSDGQPFDPWLGGYRTRPVSFTYSPAEIERIPWYLLPLSPYELPRFCLSSDMSMSRNFPSYEERWRRRDILTGFGSDRGCVRLAELLLNASRPESVVPEIVLESEAGYRGVGRKSAEARFALPGSVLWDPAQWPNS